MLAAVPSLITDAGATIVGLAATATALGALSRLRPVRWLWRQVIAQPLARWARAEVTEVVDERLAPISSELHPNGGTSLRDQVDACATELHGLRDDVTDLQAWSRRVEDRL